MTDFMPENYEEPKTSSSGNWFKINDKTKDTETQRIRIMGSFNHPHTAIMGWEAWVEDIDAETGQMKEIPIRKENTTENYDELEEADRDGKPSHFWAIQIYNYEVNEAQVWSIPQRTIQRQIRALADNPNWGDPIQYVIAITRTGLGLKTAYTLMAEPNIAPPADDIIMAMEEAKIDCREMFAREGKGNNPFGALAGEDDGMPF